MTTLTELIDALAEMRAEYKSAGEDCPMGVTTLDKRWIRASRARRAVEDAERVLCDYLVSHAADIAERERLEREVINAYDHFCLNDISESDYRNTLRHLAEWLVANAEDRP